MKEKYIAIISTAIIIIGTFLPILSTPFGSVSFFSDKSTIWDGIIFILFAILWLFLFFKNHTRKMKIVAAAAGILVIFDFFINYFKIMHVKNEAIVEFSKTQFGELAKGMISGIGLSWGWIFLIIGMLGIIYISYKDIFVKKNNKDNTEIKN